jgi:hypothetical protein
VAVDVPLWMSAGGSMSEQDGDASVDAPTGGTVIEVPVATVRITALPPTFISAGQFARDWYGDACREAETTFARDLQARRREVVCAACCAESYLVEWTWDTLRARLDHAAAFDKLRACFAYNVPAVRRAIRVVIKDFKLVQGQLRASDVDGAINGLTAALDQLQQVTKLPTPSASDQWTRIPRLLRKHGLYDGEVPTFDEPHKDQFRTLIDIRNHVTHGGISFPVIGAPTEDASRRAEVTVNDLASLAPGWAVGVVTDRIRRFHTAAGTSPPAWLVNPQTDESLITTS